MTIKVLVIVIYVSLINLSNTENADSVIEKLETKLEKVLQFVLDRYEEFNFDGLFGIVLAKGKTKNLVFNHR